MDAQETIDGSQCPRGRLALCIVSFTLFGIAGFTLNASVYAHVSSYCGIAREIATLVNAVAFLALFFMATRTPRLIDQRQLTTIGAGCALTAALILEFGLTLQVSWATIVGLIFASIASAWASTILVCAVAGLQSPRAALVSIACGMALGEIAAVAHPPVPCNIGTIETIICYLFSMLALYRAASPLFAAIQNAERPIVLELANPESFLPPSSGLYLCTLLFSIATGYGLTFGEVDRAPANIGISVAVIAGAALWLVFSRSSDKEDTLFSFCVLTVVGGFMFLTDLASANALLRIGVRCFDMLVWLVVIAVGARNPLALLPTFALVRALGALGTDIGAIAGHTTNELIGVDSGMAALITGCALFLFIAFLWTGFRSFSFHDAINGVVKVGDTAGRADAPLTLAEGSSTTRDAEDSPAAHQDPEPPTIEERCTAIGKAHGLTGREIEIFAFLARGRNGQFLMDHYVVSRNTVKSHIKHIYAKLGVHSQQELIDLVEHND